VNRYFCSKVLAVVDNRMSRMDYLVSDARKMATLAIGE
jgi:hypothetical protein